VSVSAATVEPFGKAGWLLTAGLTRPTSSGSTSMKAMSQAVVFSSPMNATLRD
jgi:hypothetical protein